MWTRPRRAGRGYSGALVRRLELVSNDGAARLIERESPDALWWQVTLDAGGPSATARVDPDGEVHKTPISEILPRDGERVARMERCEKTWESIDRTLRLNARHDGLGHIALRVSAPSERLPGRLVPRRYAQVRRGSARFNRSRRRELQCRVARNAAVGGVRLGCVWQAAYAAR